MALNIISNFAANVAHRNLVANDAAATASISKLSAGTRVLSAKDDAASLAIGSRLRAETEALRQAGTNAAQAGSLLQIADGALATVSDILVRLKTLAVQSSSGQLGASERATLDIEYQALVAEIDRIAQDTEFTGVSLINGSTSISTVRNGLTVAGDNKVQAADGFHSVEFTVAGSYVATYDATADVLTLKNLATGQSEGVAVGATAITGNNTQTVKFNNLGATIVLNAAFDKTANITTGNSATVTGGTGVIDNDTVLLTAVVGNISAVTTKTLTGSLTAATTTLTVGAFVSGAVDLTATGSKSFTLTDGTNSFSLSFAVDVVFNDAETAFSITLGELGNVAQGISGTSNTTSFSFKLGTGTTANVDSVTFSVNAGSVSALGLTGTLVTTAANADAASTAVSAAINTLNNARAGLGANQNRLGYAAANLSTAIENSEAARSELLDLDIAAEITNFTSKQILVQAGVSVLAQANQLPQNLLKLLG
ncbi:MAG: flagellin [Alphaproteobacteria bacterium]